MVKFEKVSRFANTDFPMPQRKSKNSAGYDFAVAEPVIIPPYQSLIDSLPKVKGMMNLKDMENLTKQFGARPTLVSTGVKCRMEDNQYLELSMRSSSPLKYLLLLANSIGIIDSDYCDNISNEGEIFFQVLNLSPYTIMLNKGDIIGQGIIHTYEKLDEDNTNGRVRTGGFGSSNETTGPRPS